MHFPLPNGNVTTHAELVAGLAKPGTAILESLTPEKAHIWHMASCIPGEAGELFDGLMPAMRGEAQPDIRNLVEELGDIEFYAEGIRAPLGITREEVQLAADKSGTFWDLPGRAADVFDAAKKWVIYNKDLDRAALVVALGNLDAVMTTIRIAFDIPLGRVIGDNIFKLGKRYEGGYSDAAAQARADKQETVN